MGGSNRSRGCKNDGAEQSSLRALGWKDKWLTYIHLQRYPPDTSAMWLAPRYRSRKAGPRTIAKFCKSWSQSLAPLSSSTTHAALQLEVIGRRPTPKLLHLGGSYSPIRIPRA